MKYLKWRVLLLQGVNYLKPQPPHKKKTPVQIEKFILFSLKKCYRVITFESFLIQSEYLLYVVNSNPRFIITQFSHIRLLTMLKIVYVTIYL